MSFVRCVEICRARVNLGVGKLRIISVGLCSFPGDALGHAKVSIGSHWLFLRR